MLTTYLGKGSQSDYWNESGPYDAFDPPLEASPFAIGIKQHFKINPTLNCVSVYNLESLFLLDPLHNPFGWKTYFNNNRPHYMDE